VSSLCATARELSIVTGLRQMLQNANAFEGPVSEDDRRRQVPFSVVPLHRWLAVHNVGDDRSAQTSVPKPGIQVRADLIVSGQLRQVPRLGLHDK
jgi:hypothetical protein